MNDRMLVEPFLDGKVDSVQGFPSEVYLCCIRFPSTKDLDIIEGESRRYCSICRSSIEGITRVFAGIGDSGLEKGGLYVFRKPAFVEGTYGTCE